VAPRLLSPNAVPLQLDPDVFPPDPWRLVETSFDPSKAGHRETLFTLANGYLGMRSATPDATHAYDGGTYVNGFHETWPIRYPEDAVGMARIGQTMVAVPDATGFDVSVDGETFVLGESQVSDYRRCLDLRTGQLRTELVWTTTAGRRVQCTWTRVVSMVDRHLAALSLELSSLDGPVDATVQSTLRAPFQGEVTEPEHPDEQT